LGFLVGLAAPDRDSQSVLGFLEIGDIERHQLRAPEGPTEAQQQQRTVPQALETAGRSVGHVSHYFSDRRRLAGGRGPDRTADAPQRCLDRFGIRGRFVTGELMGIFDRAAAPADGRGFQAGFGLTRQKARHGLGRGRQRGDTTQRAPCPERGEVCPVGRARRGCLVLARKVGGTVDIGGRECGQRLDLVDGESRKGDHLSL
jgi:hypothetical protein